MSEVSILQNTNFLEKYLLNYTFSTYHKWTKATATAAYDAMVLGKKVLLSPSLDQSVRLIIPDATKKLRFGICTPLQRITGIDPAMWWELAPAVADSLSFSDNFAADAGTPDYDTAKWTTIGSSTIAWTSGAMRITRTGPNQGLKSLTAKDFTNKGVSWKQPILSSNANAANAFQIAPSDGSGTFWQFEEYNGSLKVWNEGVNVLTITYNATNHLYKRIRFSGNTAIFETSPDGSIWTSIYSGTSNATRTALFIYMTSWCAGSHTVEYDDIKFGVLGQGASYKAYEGSTLVYTSTRIPGADDELRIQIVKVGANYVGKYYWRDSSTDPEQLEYTSALSSAALQALFPIFVKGEIYDNGGELRNLQIENSDTNLNSFSYNGYFAAPPSFEFPLIFKLGVLTGGAKELPNHQLIYSGEDLTTARNGILTFKAMKDWSKITGVRLSVFDVNETAATQFNIRKNNTNIFTTELTIPAGQKKIDLTDLDIDVSEDDEFIVDYKTLNKTVIAPIILELAIRSV